MLHLLRRSIATAAPRLGLGLHARRYTGSAVPEPSLTPPLPIVYVLGGYLVAINAFAVGLFGYDKFQATRRGWRIPERSLQLTALLGGWAGGLWAMQTWRHKTVKKAFREPYMLATAANGAVMAAGAGAWCLSPRFRTAVHTFLRPLTVRLGGETLPTAQHVPSSSRPAPRPRRRR